MLTIKCNAKQYFFNLGILSRWWDNAKTATVYPVKAAATPYRAVVIFGDY